MDERISPAPSLGGSVTVPGDKSISHRLAMLGSLAEGLCRLENYATGADCQSTLNAMSALGVRIERNGGSVAVHGVGLRGLRPPAAVLDAGNSGSTMRMLSGILAGQPFRSEITGDESLLRRPMDRIIKPLTGMGASIEARENRYPPLVIQGGSLRPIDYRSPVASAQVKTCVLFAGLFASGRTSVCEPAPTRDHTEIALRQFGVDVEAGPGQVALEGPARLRARDFAIPGDLSSAAFFLVAALVARESEVFLENVGLNPTRSALLEFLASAGGDIQVLDLEQSAGELCGNLRVRASRLRGGVIENKRTAALIDEIPVLAVLGALSDGGLMVRDAAELRVKETDRIATLAENFTRMNVAIDVRPDGFEVPGGQRFRAAELDSFGDHRIAMACAVAALSADGECVIRNAEAAAVSYPEFFRTLRALAA